MLEVAGKLAVGGGGGWYKLQPTDTPTFSRTNVREPAPTVAAGNVRVASANVLNFFTTFTNGRDVNGASLDLYTAAAEIDSRRPL